MNYEGNNAGRFGEGDKEDRVRHIAGVKRDLGRASAGEPMQL